MENILRNQEFFLTYPVPERTIIHRKLIMKHLPTLTEYYCKISFIQTMKWVNTRQVTKYVVCLCEWTINATHCLINQIRIVYLYCSIPQWSFWISLCSKYYNMTKMHRNWIFFIDYNVTINVTILYVSKNQLRKLHILYLREMML